MNPVEVSPPSDLVFSISSDDEKQRLDTFLGRKCAELSRSHFKRLIQDGYVLVNGRPVKPGYEVRAGDSVSVRVPTMPSQDQLTPQAMPLEILFEDDDVLVINKAPGVVVHPGAGHVEGTLVHGILAHCPRLAIQGAPQRPGIVHRLDQDTSGALVIAKSEIAYLDLIEQFKNRSIEKEYLALVYGRMPQKEGIIRTLLDRHPADRKKMAVVEGRGREAISRWHVEREWGEITLLRVRIETGRTHQIRVHLSHLQHPVVGDAAYGGGKRRAQSAISKALKQLLVSVERQMLHAWRLSFQHPASRVRMSFTAPLPSDFGRLLERINDIVPSER